VLYKSIRNTIAAIREHSDGDALSNVEFRIGQARPYTNVRLRDGAVKLHLRHGQDRKPYAGTSASHDEWVTTLQSHDFDIAAMGHHHTNGKLAGIEAPIFAVGTPKPPGDFVDKIAAATSLDPQEQARTISLCFGVSEHGVTGEYPVKTHDFDYLSS
jgi:hypothetical protein